MTRSRTHGVPLVPVLAALALGAFLAGCSRKDSPVSAAPARTFRMGFSAIPPRPDFATLLAALEMWIPRADAALISYEVPWDSLLADLPPDSIVIRNLKPLADYYRARGLALYVNVDPTNGLDRSSDAPPLVAAGRSLAEPAIQQLLRAYVTAVDTVLRPPYLGLASETNLVRAVAPASLYAAVVQVANEAAADIRALDPDVQLFGTVQVEVAWGRMAPGGSYVGIAQDRADFPFAQALGLSSYPYLGGYVDPDSLPLDYYSRLVQTSPLPEFVLEGGWSSRTVSPVATTPEMQRRYIRRQADLLEGARAIALFQLTFTDLDLAYWPPGVEPFAYLGLVDMDLNPKPALAEWDAVFARALQHQAAAAAWAPPGSISR